MQHLNRFLFLFIFVNLFLLLPVFAADVTQIISNSEQWQDVYSITHYANLRNINSDFLVSTQHGTILLTGLSKGSVIEVISSTETPFVINYPSLLRNSGFENFEEKEVENANLELINDLPAIENFVIVGSLYGYNAIAVAPYALQSKSWVFLADASNIDEIVATLNRRTVNTIIIYGLVDREVSDALESFDPEIIDTGDRFNDNIEIVKRYLAIKPVNQVVLTNGEFIEKEVMSGAEPILFTGKENVPVQIQDYLKNSDIEVGVLIGSDLVGAATNIRRSTGISVIVKFARGARAPAGTISAVEGLDLFYLPSPILNLSIHNIKHNSALNTLEVTYRSDSNAPVYFTGTITIENEGGTTITRVGDTESVFIAPLDYRTVVYPDVIIPSSTSAIADVYTLYGETPSSLEKVLQGTYSITNVNVIDRCDITIDKVIYQKNKDTFVIKIKNTAPVDCWVDVDLKDVLVGGRKKIFGSEGAVLIESGNSGKVYIAAQLNDQDLEKNSLVSLTAYYGEREDSLVKVLQTKFALTIQIINYAVVSLSILALIILIALIFFIWKRRKDEDDY